MRLHVSDFGINYNSPVKKTNNLPEILYLPGYRFSVFDLYICSCYHLNDDIIIGYRHWYAYSVTYFIFLNLKNINFICLKIPSRTTRPLLNRRSYFLGSNKLH